MACSDGYKPHIVDSEPVVWSGIVKWGTSRYPSQPYHYFTCCEPDLLSSNTNVTRHCSNSTLRINDKTTDICDNITKPYDRKMASYGPTESYVCCDSFSTNKNTTSFLNDTECVPFRNDIYSPALITNEYGFLDVVSCDNSGIYIDYQFPRKVEKENINGTFYYECCKKESKKLPPFIRNSAFKKSVYPQIVVSAIAVFLCLLLVLALLIPLFLTLKKKRDETRDVITNTNKNERSRSLCHSLMGSKQRFHSKRHLSNLAPNPIQNTQIRLRMRFSHLDSFPQRNANKVLGC